MMFFDSLLNSKGFKILLIVICLDCFFGILRAIKQHKLNSSIGIDGIIRKCGMIVATIFIKMIDYLVDLDFLGFIPLGVKEVLNIQNQFGIGSLFALLFIIFEALSVLKNMVICKLPIPKKLQKWLEKALLEFTTEIKEESEEKENEILR